MTPVTMSHAGGLPEDVWLHVLDYLREERDDSSMSLCCRLFHHMAARRRWHRISVSLPNESLRLLLLPGAAPVRYVRHLHLSSHDDQDYNAAAILTRMAQVIPSGSLHSLTYAMFPCRARS